MKNTFTLEWLKAAGIRALKTMAQTAIGMITVGAAIQDVKWLYILSVAVVAGIVSLLTSVGGLPEVNSVPSAQDVTFTAPLVKGENLVPPTPPVENPAPVADKPEDKPQ